MKAKDLYQIPDVQSTPDARKLAMALERDKAALEIDAAVRWLNSRESLHGLLRSLVTGATLETVREMLPLEPR